jgi:hypothetical protein
MLQTSKYWKYFSRERLQEEHENRERKFRSAIWLPSHLQGMKRNVRALRSGNLECLPGNSSFSSHVVFYCVSKSSSKGLKSGLNYVVRVLPSQLKYNRSVMLRNKLLTLQGPIRYINHN